MDKMVKQVSDDQPRNPVKYAVTEGVPGVEITVQEGENDFVPKVVGGTITFMIVHKCWGSQTTVWPVWSLGDYHKSQS
jgi:hypothetical protein